jgi:signal transduction histidine kinase
LINLIQNAVKFSQEGRSVSVKLNYFSVKNSQSNIGIKIKVTDFGCGIAKEDLDNLFMPYFKSNNKEVQK